jgi:hypothetical protein
MSRRDEAFRLDREQLLKYITNEYETAPRLQLSESRQLARAIHDRIEDARDSGGLSGPDNVELVTYDRDESLLIAVREDRVDPLGPAYKHQIATYPIEADRLSDGATTDTACFEAIEAVLARANQLVPMLRLLQHAEENDPASRRKREQADDARALGHIRGRTRSGRFAARIYNWDEERWQAALTRLHAAGHMIVWTPGFVADEPTIGGGWVLREPAETPIPQSVTSPPTTPTTTSTKPALLRRLRQWLHNA